MQGNKQLILLLISTSEMVLTNDETTNIGKGLILKKIIIFKLTSVSMSNSIWPKMATGHFKKEPFQYWHLEDSLTFCPIQLKTIYTQSLPSYVQIPGSSQNVSPEQ